MVMTIVVNFVDKQDLDGPKTVVKKLSFSSSTCFTQELQKFTKSSSHWFFVLTKSFLLYMHYHQSLVCAHQEGGSFIVADEMFFQCA